jgi:hypothetical protein
MCIKAFFNYITGVNAPSPHGNPQSTLLPPPPLFKLNFFKIKAKHWKKNDLLFQ